MRTSSLSPARLVRAVSIISSLVLAAGCSGGYGSSTIPNSGSTAICDSDAGSIAVARPTPGFPANGNSVEIVASTNTDTLNRNTNAFVLDIFDRFGNFVESTNPLAAVPDPGGPHPFPSDFFYAGTLPSALPAGTTFNVFLNVPSSNCTRGFVGTIST